ncbi:MAG: hypothetical protein E7052_04620 [Lentisphaerae bacterium]|nr:hypothetical protein [Lentisphaerota bacterium]
MKKLFTLFALLAGAVLFAGDFTVTGEKNDLVIKYKGEVLVKSVDLTVPAQPDKFEYKVLPDGTRVWNAWNENPEYKFRREIALHSDDHLEITLSSNVPIHTTNRLRKLTLNIPYSFVQGGKYQALSGNGRSWSPVKGEFADNAPNKAFPKAPWRFLALEKAGKDLIFDFNPIGAGDYCSSYAGGAVRSVWIAERKNDTLELFSGSTVPVAHDFSGLKMTIRAGKFADYDKYHAMRAFTSYSNSIAPLGLYSFGESQVGDIYQAINLRSYTRRNRIGWVGFPELKAHSSNKEGAYYSHLAGQDATFRRSNLRPGFYIVTVGAGNGSGTGNNFSVSVNGQELQKNISVKPNTIHLASKVFHVGNDGIIDIKFDGKFIVSTIGLQFLIADAEDFSCHRGFWVVDGFEPASIYRNIDYKKAPVWSLAADTFALPVPGKEASNAANNIKKEVLLPDSSAPELAWTRGGHWFKVLSNSSTLSEADTPEKAERLLKSKTDGKKYSAVMFSGMHSRHTYINHLQRGLDAFKVMCAAADKFDLKVIDHHDATLCWNIDAGFRAMGELLHECCRDIKTMLPDPQLCPSSPEFSDRYSNYLIELVKNGVDGFQIDELHYWPTGCSCEHCREKFLAATGCYFPVNELDKNVDNKFSELMRYWFEWRKAAVADWFVELRKRCMPYNKNLLLSMYTTHWGFSRSLVRYNACHDLFELARAINYFGTEVMSRNPLMTFRSLLPFRRMKNVLTLTYQSPVWAWIYASGHPQIYAGWAASNMANQVALLPELVCKPGQADFMQFDTSKANMPRTGVTAHAKIAVLFSQASRDWGTGISFENELFGLAQTLDAENISYEFICDNQLNSKDLSKYSALLLATSTALSNKSVKVIKDFAAAGNVVVITTLSGFYDEMGRKQKVWPFKEVFNFTPHLSKSIKVEQLMDSKLMRPVALRKLNGQVSDVTRYGVTKQGGKLPLTVEKAFGKGKFIYISAVLGAELYEREASHRFPYRAVEFDPAVDKVYRQILTQILADARVWELQAPEQVYSALWSNQDTIYVHLFNATGVHIKAGEKLDPKAPAIPYPAIAEDMSFTLKLPAAPAEVTAYSPDFAGGKALAASFRDGQLQVKLPRELLKSYTLIHVKK